MVYKNEVEDKCYTVGNEAEKDQVEATEPNTDVWRCDVNGLFRGSQTGKIWEEGHVFGRVR